MKNIPSQPLSQLTKCKYCKQYLQLCNIKYKKCNIVNTHAPKNDKKTELRKKKKKNFGK